MSGHFIQAIFVHSISFNCNSKMKVSKSWLQNYIVEKLPPTDKLVEAFTMHAFEVEGVEKYGDLPAQAGDDVIDVKVLPDRAHYALSHYGVASEIAVILRLTLKPRPAINLGSENSNAITVEIEDGKLCRRYCGAIVKGVKVGPSPDWLKAQLEAVGQRSINNIVDATNYVMFSIGQPLHAFDADKLQNKNGIKISIEKIKSDEKVTALDAKEYDLKSGTLVIADGNSHETLAIAGVKGGAYAAISDTTTNLVLESANFDPVIVRKTGRSLGLITDAQRRFENELTPELAIQGLSELVALITEVAGGEAEGHVDEYPAKFPLVKVSVSLSQINSILGVTLIDQEVEDILNRFHFKVEKTGNSYEVTIPAERIDLRIKEDLVEEIGRIYGYDRIDAKTPEKENDVPINKQFAYTSRIKNILVDMGFSEVYTYSFTDNGELEVANPLAVDKGFLRKSLTPKIAESLEFNLRNADLLGLDQIKIFEVGRVFKKDTEYNSLCIGVSNVKGFKNKSLPKGEQLVNGEIRAVREMLWEKLGANIQTLCTIDDSGGIMVSGGEHIGEINSVDGIMELNLDALIEKLPEIGAAEDASFQAGGHGGNAFHEASSSASRFQTVSPYPFIIRDIAVFVPGEQSDENQNKVLELIKSDATDLLIRLRLFDVFSKDNRTSYAFRLVFQSMDHTLTDGEINKIMETITSKMNANEGWQVR